MFNGSRLKLVPTVNGSAAKRQYMLWIDGVGAYLLCLGEEVTIGGPGRDAHPADVPMLANLSRQHATIVRNGEGYLLRAHGPSQVGGRSVEGKAFLSNRCEILLGGNVRFGFRLPTALSATARLDFLSDHRLAQSVDGIVLMDDNCLLGPGIENHICCPEWPESVVLFRKADELWCKSRGDLFVDGKLVNQAAALYSGCVVTGLDLRFRIEERVQ